MLHIVILCKSNNYTKKLTNDLLSSIHQSSLAIQPFDCYETIIVESGEKTQYNCDKIIQYDRQKFNYNHACNLAIKYINEYASADDWTCFMNNDIICNSDWIVELYNAYVTLPSLGSMCPNPGLDGINDDNCEIILGHILQKTFFGCCFILKNSTIDAIKEFDEQFSFYFQDDDLLEVLRLHNIENGLIVKSKITHIGQGTTKTEDIDQLKDGAITFIRKYSMNTFLKREMTKNTALKLKKADVHA